MQFKAAVITEQGVTFALVGVYKHVVDNPDEAARAVKGIGPLFPGLPVVLVGKDLIGRPTYFGRADICQFMAMTPIDVVPWQRYTLEGGKARRLGPLQSETTPTS